MGALPLARSPGYMMHSSKVHALRCSSTYFLIRVPSYTSRLHVPGRRAHAGVVCVLLDIGCICLKGVRSSVHAPRHKNACSLVHAPSYASGLRAPRRRESAGDVRAPVYEMRSSGRHALLGACSSARPLDALLGALSRAWMFSILISVDCSIF